MIKVVNECVGCDMPCMGDSCPYRNVTRAYCDCCDEETENIYYFDGEELCIDCIEERLEKVSC